MLAPAPPGLRPVVRCRGVDLSAALRGLPRSGPRPGPGRPLGREPRVRRLGSSVAAAPLNSSSSVTETQAAREHQPDQPQPPGDGGPLGAAAANETSWGEDEAPSPDWQGARPFSLKDVDWGLAGLLSVILLLSFGAFRVLNHFRVYQHSRPSGRPQVTTMIEQPSRSTPAQREGGSSKQKPGRSSKGKAQERTPGGGSSKGELLGEQEQEQQQQQQDDAAGRMAPAFPGAAAAAAAAAPPALDLQLPGGLDPSTPPANAPGGPQPSPLDAGFSSSPSLPPWAGTDLGQLSLAPLELPDGVGMPPLELPSIKVDAPARAVSQLEAAALPSDPSLPSLRERAQIAMRASGAAMEAAQRASAYSAAASSAASRAAEAAEGAAAAASQVQSALEAAAEEAMVQAVKRMNRAVEMVADAESRAAAAAATATAYQDIADAQAAAAAMAADLPALPAKAAGPAGHIANLHQVLHEQMFSAGGVLGDWASSVWGGVLGFVAWLRGLLAGAWSRLVSAVVGS